MNPIESILQDLLDDIRSCATFHKTPGAHVYTVTCGYIPEDEDSELVPDWRPEWKKAQKAMAEFHNAKFVVDVTDDNPFGDLRFVITVQALSIEDVQNPREYAQRGLQALQEIYGVAPKGSSRRCPDRTTFQDFLTDMMHLLGHAETTRIFDIAGDHWEEERAK